MTNNFARENDSSEATVDTSVVYAEGAFKNVYKGKYTEGERNGEECVCKIFKSGSVFEESYFNNELKVVKKALEIINQFNKNEYINKSIWLNMPTVWTFLESSSRSGEKALIEPMISNFEKFNSNTGWTPNESSPWIEVMQALSHYSYHSTGRKLLFCDLQGGIYRDGFIITDPVIMSTTQEYGPTDLGSEGISTFFARHRCNKFCDKQWVVPQEKKVYFKVQKGSTMTLPTRRSRAPLTGNSTPVDSGHASIDRLFEGLEIIEE
jgi:hypothetical protein